MPEVTRNPLLHCCCRTSLKLAMPLFFRLRAWDVDNVPTHGGMLLVSNHESFLDPMMIGPSLPRSIYYMARRSLYDAPVFGWLIRAVKTLPVERGGGERVLMRMALDVLSRGEGLLVFAEGTRSPDGEVKPFTAGFALLAARAKVPIVPVGVHGGFEAWPRHRLLPRFGVTHVAFGEPLPPPGAQKGACRATAEETRQRVLSLVEMLKQKQ